MLLSVPFSDVRKQRHRRINKTFKDHTATERQKQDWNMGRHPLEATLFVGGPLTKWKLLSAHVWETGWICLWWGCKIKKQFNHFTCGSKLARSSSVRVPTVCKGLSLASMSQETTEPLGIARLLYFYVLVCLGVSGCRLLDGSLRVIRGALSPSA